LPSSLGRIIILAGLLLHPFLLIGCTSKGPTSAHVLTFEKDLKTLMTNYCFECHGKETREAGLDLRSVEFMLLGGESGPALVAGKPGESLLLDMVLDGHMPPDGKMPDARETDLLARWIRQGAN
ncbi:MAG: c-type cytochrome domain-containing protein, partial [Verrucomicrobiota bacterium]|nr:c-type cytochrome domain-containing protein [Verrucomicrobiota bacterium]